MQKKDIYYFCISKLWCIFVSSKNKKLQGMRTELENIIEGLAGSYNPDDFRFTISMCEDGRVSLYANSDFGVKVRMSNHSVLSNSRIMNEIHLPSFRKCGSVEGCIAAWNKYFDFFYSRNK
jgi:hypothetical protein